MPSKDPRLRFEDILRNIELIEEFTAGMTLSQYCEDAKTSNAVERCLERISEAAKKLEGVAEMQCPEIAWGSVRAMGNLMRHEYDRVDQLRVWLVLEEDLPVMKAAVGRALGQLG